MPPVSIETAGARPAYQDLSKSYDVYCYGRNAVGHLFDTFDKNRTQQGAGAPPVVDQDLLRSAIMIAGATFDSSVKHLIKDSLEEIVLIFSETESSFRIWIERRLKKYTHEQLATELSKAFTTTMPYEYFLEEYLQDLIGSSLQSFDQIAKIWTLFGLGSPDHVGEIRDALKARNKIVHELDVDFDLPTRNRNQRQRDSCARMCNHLLRLTYNTISGVDARIATVEAT